MSLKSSSATSAQLFFFLRQKHAIYESSALEAPRFLDQRCAAPSALARCNAQSMISLSRCSKGTAFLPRAMLRPGRLTSQRIFEVKALSSKNSKKHVLELEV